MTILSIHNKDSNRYRFFEHTKNYLFYFDGDAQITRFKTQWPCTKVFRTKHRRVNERHLYVTDLREFTQEPDNRLHYVFRWQPSINILFSILHRGWLSCFNDILSIGKLCFIVSYRFIYLKIIFDFSIIVFCLFFLIPISEAIDQ